jgi:rhodanese-related sulfurtransferase
MVSADLASWQISRICFEGAPEPACPLPEVVAPGQIAPEDMVIDLRRGETAPAMPPPDRRVVVLCVTGLRAWRVARQLIVAGHDRVAIAAAPATP